MFSRRCGHHKMLLNLPAPRQGVPLPLHVHNKKRSGKELQ